MRRRSFRRRRSFSRMGFRRTRRYGLSRRGRAGRRRRFRAVRPIRIGFRRA